jgi:hypothetical protein
MTGQLNISSGGLLVTGGVGIGTAIPAAKLDVVGGNGDGIQYRTSTRSIGIGQISSQASLFWGSSTDLTFFAGSELARLTSGGNLGIGTTSVNARLDVYSATDLGAGANGIRVQRPGSYGQYGYLEYLVSSDMTVLGSLYTGGGAGAFGQLTFRQHSSTTSRDSMVLTSSGNLGIGTSAPSQRLHVDGGSALIANGSSNTALWLGNSSYGFELEYSTGKIHTTTNGAKRVTVDNSGNVGIGTTTPAYKLDVNGASIFRDTLNFGSGGFISWTSGYSDGTSQTFQSPTSGSLAFITNSALAMFIKSNQNVGIGTTNPGAALDVNGTIRSRGGAFQLNDGTTTGGGLYFYKSITGSGSVLDPSIFAEGSSGTGNVHIMTGGSVTTRMWVGHNGRVGIGTTSPGNPLTVNGTIQAINGEILLTQNYSITWNNGDNYIKGVSGYHIDLTTYDGVSAQQDGIRVLGGTSKSARALVHGGIRYGRALSSGAANKVIRGWHNYTTPGNYSGTLYVHFKTNMWAGGSPNGNIQYTMSLFRATGYDYSAATIDSLLGFHNWVGSAYSLVKQNLGTKSFWENPYTSADGYIVLVGNLTNYNYLAVSIDWFQTFGYPFVDAWVTAETTSTNATGAY